MKPRKRFRLAMMLIVVVLATGATGFHFIEGWSWFDGMYMTLITMTTVGYGETHPLSDVGKVFNTFLIIASVMTGGFLVATFTHAMLEFELGQVLGRRRMERELSRMKNHYIICGAGRVGRTVGRELRKGGVPCVFIEKEASRAEWAIKENFPVIVGAGTTEEVLSQARIETAEGLVAAVTSDADNLYIVLTARGMRSDLKIITRASEEEAIPKLKRAGATEVVSPYHFIGHRIAQFFLHPHVQDFMDTAFGDTELDIKIEQVLVHSGSSIAGQTLSGCGIQQKTGVMVLAVRKADGTMQFNPAPDTDIQAGDHLIAVGGSEHLQKLESLVGA